MNGARISGRHRVSQYVVRLSSWLGLVLFVLAVAWPTAALLIRAFVDGVSPGQAVVFSTRHQTLMVRTLGLTAAATLLTVGLAIAIVCSVSHRGFRRHALALLLSAVCLACPPSAYAFGWETLLPASVPAALRCIGTWSLWMAPAAVLMIAMGWHRSAQGGYEAALLDSSRWRAFVHVGIPLLAPYIALCASIVFVFLLNEYTVPHACGLVVYATELLGVASSSTRVADVLVSSLPPVGVTVIGLSIIYLLVKRSRMVAPPSGAMLFPNGRDLVGKRMRKRSDKANLSLPDANLFDSRRFLLSMAILFGIACVLPLLGLILRLEEAGALSRAIRVYGRDIGATMLVGLTAGLCATLIGMVAVAKLRTIPVLLPWTILFGVLPGAVVGVGLIAAYNTESFAWLFDRWPILVTGHVARFAWVSVLAGLLVRRMTPTSLLEQARADGASPAALFVYLRLGIGWPVAVAGGLLVAVLSLGEIATTSLLRVPDFSPVSLVIVEKFHRFEDDMLAALCLILVGSCILGVLAVSLLVRRAYAIARGM